MIELVLIVDLDYEFGANIVVSAGSRIVWLCFVVVESYDECPNMLCVCFDFPEKKRIIASTYAKHEDMLYLNQAYELLTGGYYIGNSSWNKKHTEIDNCFKLYQLVGGEVFVSDGTQTFRLQKGRLYFINGNKLATQYCDYSFSTHWLHFMPKDLMVHQGLLSLPAVVELPADRVGLPEVMPRLQALLDSSVSSGWEYALGCLEVQTLLQTATLRLFDLHPAGLQPVSFAMKKIEPAMRYMNQHFR